MTKMSLMLIPIIVFLGISCDNATDANGEKELISVTLKKSEIYVYKTGIGGDEEGASIIRQASHFEISDILRNAETSWEAVYTYKPTSGFSGKDYVELKLSSGSDGASPPTKIEIIKIEFIVN